MKKNHRNVALIFATVLALTACQPQAPQMPPQFENPVQQPQVPQAQEGFDVGDAAVGAAVGAAAGYMLGNSGSRGRETVIYDNRRPSYGYSNRGYSKKVTTTTVKRGLFGKTVTRTVTKRRR